MTHVICTSSTGLTSGVILHETRQLRQILDWAPAIDLIGFNQSQVNQITESHLEHLKTRGKITMDLNCVQKSKLCKF